jgi:hypothetical protein
VVLIFVVSPLQEKEQALKKNWHDFDSDIDPNLLDYLAKEQLSLARWRGATSKGSGSQTLGDLKANYPGRWLAGWTGILENAAGEQLPYELSRLGILL